MPLFAEWIAHVPPVPPANSVVNLFARDTGYRFFYAFVQVVADNSAGKHSALAGDAKKFLSWLSSIDAETCGSLPRGDVHGENADDLRWKLLDDVLSLVLSRFFATDEIKRLVAGLADDSPPTPEQLAPLYAALARQAPWRITSGTCCRSV